MNLSALKNIPPWEWPEGTGRMLLDVLRDGGVSASDLLLATELAGDFTIIDDELVDALLSILRRADKSAELRGRAAISLGPVLEQADLEGFEEPEDIPITEPTFRRIQKSLRDLYAAADVPKEARRRILEASVRAPENWHVDAIRAAYAGDDDDWKLTAVFCMRFVRGFEAQILEALESGNGDVHYEAVAAAGNWGVDAAWPYVVGILTSEEADKPLLLAAIEAAASIRPHEAEEVLGDLVDSDDEDVAAAVEEALVMAEGLTLGDESDENGDDDDFLR